MDLTLELLFDRVVELEIALGEETDGSLTIAAGVDELKKKVKEITNYYGRSLEELCRYLLVFHNEPLNSSNLTIWFKGNSSQILKLVSELELLDSKLLSGVENALLPYKSLPRTEIAIRELHHFTENVLKLIFRSYVLINRYINLSIEESETWESIEKRLRILDRRILNEQDSHAI